MRKSILPFVVAGICTAAAAEDVRVHDGDVLKRGRDRQALMKAAMGAAGMPSPADVGDADSFGRNVHFLGVAQTGLVQILPPGSCPPPDPNFPDDRCVEANPDARVDARDIGRMKLPGKAANSILCHSITTIPFWEFSNFTGGRVFAFFNYVAGVTIENEVLNDPSLIDPNTGLPFNGKMDVRFGIIRDGQTIDPGVFVQRTQGFTRGCIGGLVSKQGLIAMGLTDAQATEFFKKPMTLRLNMTLNTISVDDAFVLFGLRIFAD